MWVYMRTRRMYYCGTEFKEATSHSHFPLPISISLKILWKLYTTVQPLKMLCDLGIEKVQRLGELHLPWKDSLKTESFMSFSFLDQNQPKLRKERSWLHFLENDFPMAILYPVRKIVFFSLVLWESNCIDYFVSEYNFHQILTFTTSSVVQRPVGLPSFLPSSFRFINYEIFQLYWKV